MKKQKLTNFSQDTQVFAEKYSPGFISEIAPLSFHARGQGLSYSDCALSNTHPILDTTQLNHFINFDVNTGIITIEPGVKFNELLFVHSDYIPPVIPGTCHATIAGGIANDIHGKNNPDKGNIGHHILWMTLLIEGQYLRVSPTENTDLFHATIGGLGLTGIITEIGLQMRKQTAWVQVNKKPAYSIEMLLNAFETSPHEYQVAWIDGLNNFKAIFTEASHTSPEQRDKQPFRSNIACPKLPFSCIYRYPQKLFNWMYYQLQSFHELQTIPILQFNNPLDSIANWQHLYGPRGLKQFQALIPFENAHDNINAIFEIIKKERALPTLIVMKQFKQRGLGLLSFTKPGITLAIDFPNTKLTHRTILALNALIATINGNIYLAKDSLLTPELFRKLYPNHIEFTKIRKKYGIKHSSLLAERLEIS